MSSKERGKEMKIFKAYVKGGYEETFEFDDDVDTQDAEDVMYDWAEQYLVGLWGYKEIKEEE